MFSVSQWPTRALHTLLEKRKQSRWVVKYTRLLTIQSGQTGKQSCHIGQIHPLNQPYYEKDSYLYFMNILMLASTLFMIVMYCKVEIIFHIC